MILFVFALFAGIGRWRLAACSDGPYPSVDGCASEGCTSIASAVVWRILPDQAHPILSLTVVGRGVVLAMLEVS